MDIHDEITIPGQEARHGDAPAWLSASPTWPAVKAQTGAGQLYLHQAMGLDLLGQGHNLVISTGTASGKSLVFQAPTLHHLAIHPNATAIAIYPIKARARDQVIRWQNMAKAAGLDPAAINRIDGDVRDLTERRQILQRTRLALMTPDVIQQWLMAYSEPLHGRRPLRHDLREVQNTQYNVRRFISNLAFLILDEAHTYDGALGTHCLYLLHRLQQKRRELMSQFEPLRVIAASATIHNPAQHLETLTGMPFQVVEDRYNGSPRAELTVQHVVGREPHDEGWRDLQAAVREVIGEDPERSYIAFIDDRQLAERAAAGIEAARSITEDAIIVESRDAMAYRSGLMRRERIEEALRAGDIRGLASTGAMELGMDIPDLQVGFNLGLPHSVGRLKQRAGRVGRTGPGRFIIVAPRHAFQFHEDSLAVYWEQPVEPARLYPSNPNIRNTHGRCLAKETDLNGMERNIPSPTDAWPEQLPQTLREIARGDHYAPEFQTGDPQQPHRNDIRDAADGRARIGTDGRASGQRSERERLLREDTAATLHRWAAAVAPNTLSPEQTPVITEYGGTTFRSQLEARWAAYFNRRGITWEYEPARFDGWTPDFRLVMDGVEAYAEVKPVTEFPMDVAQRVLNAGCDADVLILGNGPRHAWLHRDGGWGLVDVTA